MCFLSQEDAYDFKWLLGFFPNKIQSFIIYFFFISNTILKYKLIFVIHEHHLFVLSSCLFLYVNLSENFCSYFEHISTLKKKEGCSCKCTALSSLISRQDVFQVHTNVPFDCMSNTIRAHQTFHAKCFKSNFISNDSKKNLFRNLKFFSCLIVA